MAVDAGALLIGLREGLEALLVLGILFGMLRRFGHPEKGRLLWFGAAAGVAASVLVGLLIEAFVATWFESQGGAALFEIIVAVTAVSILTYMIIWMQKHTMQLLATAKRAVQVAVDDGRWMVLATLAFVTVFREGLETVLFYAARAGDVSWTTLIVSGVIGFAISAVIAFAIFRLTVQVDLRKFFAITGTLLVFIAAGLLIHVAHAMADLGWIGHGTPLWDTSGILPDEDHWLGGPLHALIGYEDQPTAFGLLLYLTYLVGVGGFYLAGLAKPTRRTPARIAAGAILLLVVSGFAFAGAIPARGPGDHAGHDAAAAHAGVPHEELFANATAALAGFNGKVGVLVRAHGEPVHYNATTYESFKAFVDAFWPYTGLPQEMLQVDHGTVLIDKAHPWAEEPQVDANLMDAWLTDYPYPAIPITDPAGLHSLDEDLAGGQFYLAPGNGPGVGEGDIYEAVGLGAYRLWLKMENESPMYGYVQQAWDEVEHHAYKHWGDKVVIAFAHHVDPKVDANETTEAAARYLVSQGVDVVVDAYMSSVHSDAMNTCMMMPHTEHALREAGFKGPIVSSGMAGTAASWARATADYAQELVAELPADAPVSILLAQHGGNPASQNLCEDGPEQYHANTKAEFENARTEVAKRFPDRAVTIRHVYGQGAGSPDDGVLSPIEALELDRKDGVEHSIIIPYEFWGNAMDNLVPLRESLGFAPPQLPYYDANYETRMTYHGIDVLVASAHFGTEAKAEALLVRISEAFDEAVQATEAGHGGGHIEGHPAGWQPATALRRKHEATGVAQLA